MVIQRRGQLAEKSTLPGLMDAGMFRLPEKSAQRERVETEPVCLPCQLPRDTGSLFGNMKDSWDGRPLTQQEKVRSQQTALPAPGQERRQLSPPMAISYYFPDQLPRRNQRFKTRSQAGRHVPARERDPWLSCFHSPNISLTSPLFLCSNPAGVLKCHQST